MGLQKEINSIRNSLDNISKHEKKEEIDELKSFLTHKKYKVYLIEYYNVFKEEGFEEMDLLKDLTDNDLKNDLKIMKKAHRMKILRGIRILNQNDDANNDNISDNDQNIPDAAYNNHNNNAVYEDDMVEGPHVINT